MRSQTSCRKKSTSIVTIIKTPVRVVSKALDLYVKGVNNFSAPYSRPISTKQADANCHRLPRSFSTSKLSNNDQLVQAGALVRSISVTAGSRDTLHNRHKVLSYASRKASLRSCSIGLGKIDEDRVSSFKDNNFVLKSTLSVNNKY